MGCCLSITPRSNDRNLRMDSLDITRRKLKVNILDNNVPAIKNNNLLSPTINYQAVTLTQGNNSQNYSNIRIFGYSPSIKLSNRNYIHIPYDGATPKEELNNQYFNISSVESQRIDSKTIAIATIYSYNTINIINRVQTVNGLRHGLETWQLHNKIICQIEWCEGLIHGREDWIRQRSRIPGYINSISLNHANLIFSRDDFSPETYKEMDINEILGINSDCGSCNWVNGAISGAIEYQYLFNREILKTTGLFDMLGIKQYNFFFVDNTITGLVSIQNTYNTTLIYYNENKPSGIDITLDNSDNKIISTKAWIDGRQANTADYTIYLHAVSNRLKKLFMSTNQTTLDHIIRMIMEYIELSLFLP